MVLTFIAAYLFLDNGRPPNSTRAVAEQGNVETSEEATTSVTLPTTTLSPTTIASTIATTTTAAPTTTTGPVITPVNALLIGDSVLAELRWFDGAVVSLEGFSYTLDAESCRRISWKSCRGRERRTADSVVKVLNGMNESFDVIVLLGGYHASQNGFRGEIEDFIKVASKMATKVVIINYKESLHYPSPGSNGTKSLFADFNEDLRAMEAEGALGGAIVADWNMFTQDDPTWFRADKMHPNVIGTLAMGWFVSATIAELYNNPCPVTGNHPCVVPDARNPITDWLTMYGMEYTDQHCYEDGSARERVCEEDRIMY
ncbi:MAG: hypothetical protein ABL953_07370 [Ilumatobacteraceae bacterium]